MFKDSNFSTILSMLIIYVFGYNYPSRHKVVSHWGFDLYSLMTNVEHFFICILAIFISLNRYLFRYFTQIEFDYFSFYCWVVIFLCFLDANLVSNISYKRAPHQIKESQHSINKCFPGSCKTDQIITILWGWDFFSPSRGCKSAGFLSSCDCVVYGCQGYCGTGEKRTCIQIYK